MKTNANRDAAREKTAAARARVADHIASLAAELAAGHSERMEEYLAFSRKFHRYSFNNQMMILLQNPDATRVAGFNTWRKVGRHVRKGEKGIAIFAPCIKKGKKKDEEDAQEEGRRSFQEGIFFRLVYVFDVSQTEGEELPESIWSEGDATETLPALIDAVKNSGIELNIVRSIDRHPRALGVSYGGRIAIRGDLEDARGFTTLAHEWAHEILHQGTERDPDHTKTLKEMEAESVAYAVSRHFGITCNAADYLLCYGASVEDITASLERIQGAVSLILDQIEAVLPKYQTIQEEAA